MRIVLASASPARLDLLSRAGVRCDVVVSGVDEDALSAPTPADLVAALAEAKGRAVAARLETDGAGCVGRPALVVAADTVLERGGCVEGKPADAVEAVARWRSMRGGSGVVLTGHWLGLLGPDGLRVAGPAVARTAVHFADVTDAEVDAYVATGEPLRAAGAFSSQALGGPFVERIEGDHHNVVGLSLPLLRRMVADLGLAWPDLWSPTPTL